MHHPASILLIKSCIIGRSRKWRTVFFILFKKKKTAEPAKAPVEDVPLFQEPRAEAEPERIPTKTTINRDAPKKTYGKEEPVKKAPAKKEPVKKEPAKKESAKKAPAEKKALAKKPVIPSPAIPGKVPKELRGFESELKGYAAHSRMPFSSETANMVFTEYMAKVFREAGYKMVLIRDQENGIITMLDKDKAGDEDIIKGKLVVKCVYMKKGSVDPQPIISAQEEGALNRADETWCITTTDFTQSAIRRSRKPDAKVKLLTGQKLYKEFLSKNEDEE